MTWTDDKEAEHQRIRADFAEAELDRLREVINDFPVDGANRLLDELERLRKENARLRKTLEVYDVPRVTEAERAEAQRVRENIEERGR